MRDATTDNSGQITSRTEYDGYGVEALLSGTASVRGDNKWAGKAGYLTEPENGLVLMGHRYYLPAIGRFLTQDPIGLKGGNNLYAYVGNSPLSQLDPEGTDGNSISDAFHAIGNVFNVIGKSLAHSRASWRAAFKETGDWATAKGGTKRYYGPKTQETKNLEFGSFGRHLRDIIRQKGYPLDVGGAPGASGDVNSAAGLGLTLYDGLMNGTEAQVGGFGWSAHRVAGQRYYDITIYNVIGADSAFYHIPGLVGAPFGWNGNWDRGSGNLPMGNIHQTFHYRDYLATPAR